MHSTVNFYHTSEFGEERNVIIKKAQAKKALAQLAIVFKVFVNACTFKIHL